jgi:RNA polymerase-binding transcription factor DksA
MNKQVLTEIKKKLEAEKERLEKELSQFTTRDQHNEDNYQSAFPHFGSKSDENAAEVTAFTDRLSLEGVLEKSLRDVNSALVRIKKGTYGICKYCRKEIEEKRLLVRPVSSACIACKKKLTKEE